MIEENIQWLSLAFVCRHRDTNTHIPTFSSSSSSSFCPVPSLGSNDNMMDITHCQSYLLASAIQKILVADGTCW